MRRDRRVWALLIASVSATAIGFVASGRGHEGGADDNLASRIAYCAARSVGVEMIDCAAGVLRPVFSQRGIAGGIRAINRLAVNPRLRPFRANCHRTMHQVAAAYARGRRLTMERLQYHLAKTYGPGCASGFNHGLIIHAGAQLDPGQLVASERRICGRIPHRFGRYACVHGLGHAFMVIWEGQLSRALEWCRRLGPAAAADCADAAFHGTALEAAGREPPPPPRRLCQGRHGAFAEVCWRRAWTSILEYETSGGRLPPFEDWLIRCGRQPAPSRAGCITTASRHDAAARGLRLCSRLAPVDRVPCVKGIPVSRLSPADRDQQLALIVGCRRLATGSEVCAEVLGRNLNVLTNGAFAGQGCARLRWHAGRRACRRGAERSDGALLTYG